MALCNKMGLEAKLLRSPFFPYFFFILWREPASFDQFSRSYEVV